MFEIKRFAEKRNEINGKIHVNTICSRTPCFCELLWKSFFWSG